MNILFTICGRAGSKGVKNKNIKDFLDIPLVYYTLAAIKLAVESVGEEVTYRIALNTDSRELVELVGAQKMLDVDVLWRDESLGGDAVPKVAVIKDCYQRSVAAHGMDFDTVVDLDITSPLRCAQDVANAIQTKMQRPDVDVVYSVTNARRNPFFNMVKQEGDFFVKAVASNFTSRQQAPVFYDMNASIYAYSTRALREKDNATFFNDGAFAVMMKDTAVLDIDSEEDYELMEVIARYLFARYADFASVRELAQEIKCSCG